ncbi:MAG: hypothetical protein AAGJ35_16340, partial [Myxococcota bacterium]
RIFPSIQALLNVSLYAFQYQGLERAQKRKIWSRFVQWSHMSTSILAEAFRLEAQHAKSVFGLLRSMKTQKLFKANVAVPKELEQYSWRGYHFLDYSQVEQLIDRQFRCLIYYSRLPFSKKTFTACPVETYLQKIHEQSAFLIAFRKNGVGKWMLHQISPSYRSFVILWHEFQCVNRARLVFLQRAVGQMSPQERRTYDFVVQGKELKNPFTHAPFSKALEFSCMPPSWAVERTPLMKYAFAKHVLWTLPPVRTPSPQEE